MLQQPKHLLTGTELAVSEINNLLHTAAVLKQERSNNQLRSNLAGCHLALLFDKPSLRTRFSFTIAMRELGGDVIESTENSRKSEAPEDQAGVLGGYCHAVMVRTHSDSILERMSKTAKMPIINGLSDLHHPCQILSDLLTLKESFSELKGLTVAYIGDGNNILHSLLLIAPALGINIHYCCPAERSPDKNIVAKSIAQLTADSGKIKAFAAPDEAVKNAQAVYTDVWTSMGFENQRADHLFAGFQINETLMAKADKNAIFMHCLPMQRGVEVSETLPDQPYSVIYRQSENRLHMQKALLLHLIN